MHREAIEALDRAGILRGTGCGPQRLCPNDHLPRWAVAVWLVRALDGRDPPRTAGSRFADVEAGWWWRPHVERLAELGVTKGCARNPARYCPQRPVTRAQAASFLKRAFRLGPAPSAGFTDTSGSTHELAIDAVAAAGIIASCEAVPRRYCPQRPVTRAQMATFLHRALDFNRTVTWLSAGDSYSSGVGTDPHGQGRCERSPDATGPAAARLLRARGWTISDTHTACAGGLIEDMFNRRPQTPNRASMWQEHTDAGRGPPRVDVIALSLGGNDLGYEDVVLACVPFTRVTELFGAGCPSEDALRARTDNLLAPSKNCPNASRAAARRDYACALRIAGGEHGSIVELYRRISAEHLTERSRLYVIGYPSLIAPSSEWRLLSGCWAVYKPQTVNMLGRLARYLNQQLAEAVERANDELGGGDRVHYLDTYTPFREGKHEVCGRGRDYIHGITHVGVDLRTGWQRSFHPNNAGHAAMAQILAESIQATFTASLGSSQPWAG